jgi:hypothetical protein
MPDEPGWYPDPKGQANFRFHDGRKWTNSVADDKPGEVRVDDGPVEGGLLGLLDHQPINTPMEPEKPFSAAPTAVPGPPPPPAPPPQVPADEVPPPPPPPPGQPTEGWQKTR